MVLILYIIFGLLLVGFELKRNRGRSFDVFSIFGVTFLLSYVAPGIFLEVVPPNAWWSMYSVEYGIYERITVLICVIVFYFFYALTYMGVSRFYAQKAKQRGAISLSKPFPIITTMVICLLVGIISTWLYSYTHGGLITSMAKAGLYRSGAIEADQLSFLKRFYVVPMIGGYLAVAVVFLNYGKRFISLALGIPLLGVTVIGMLMNSGRARLIILILGIAMVYFWCKRKISLPILTLLAIPAVLVILFGKSIANIVSMDDEDLSSAVTESVFRWEDSGRSVIVSLLSEFQHYTLSTVPAAKNSNDLSNMRFYVDVPVSILNLLPESVTPIRLPDKVSYANTETLTGIYDSTIPPGIVAYSLMNIGFFGLLLTPMALAFVSATLQGWIFFRPSTRDPSIAIMHIALCLTLGYYVIQGEPANLVMNAWFFLIYMIFTYMWNRYHEKVRNYAPQRERFSPLPGRENV